ncbi:MAG: galactose mutarotase [Spirochaetales bacterium]|nr:galactose mutarotase [Spirochaetales bacterium]
MKQEQRHWGTVGEKQVFLFTLSNENGYAADISNYGGIVAGFRMPDLCGKVKDIVLGFSSLDEYLKDHPNIGTLIGRYGNRIANACFSLDGITYRLLANDGKNTLHSGNRGFGRQVWKAESVNRPDAAGIRLSYLSPDGEDGFPGNLRTEVTYWLTGHNELEIEYRASTDKPTVIAFTNHAYWNLSGEGSGDILSHELELNAKYITIVREGLIPTGEFLAVKNTPFDFTVPTPIGLHINDESHLLTFGFGYDHNWVIDRSGETGLVQAASLYEPDSGRYMEVFTTEPGIQFYAGNHLDGTLVGKSNLPYTKRSGLCLETQHFPDSPNHANFPSTVLRQNEDFYSRTLYRFSVRSN